MISNNTDKDWEKFGKENPYFGVLSEEAFKNRNLDAQALDRFFKSGSEYVEVLFEAISRYLGEEFKPKSVMDFGCGVGRLAIPLAVRCEHIVGVDVSASMLLEAERNCKKMNVKNAKFRASVQDPGSNEKFDMVNSYIVFQHIPPARGYTLFQELVNILAPGGVGALHVTFSIRTTRLKKVAGWLRRRFQPFNVLINLIKGISLGEPFMQMNGYQLNELLAVVQKSGCNDVFLSLTNHQGHAGAVLLFRKPK